MALHRWSLICQSWSPDAANNLNLTGVLDEIHVSGIPPEKVNSGDVGLELDLHFVSSWHRDVWDQPEKLEIRLIYRSPSGEKIGETEPLAVRLDEYKVVRLMTPMLAFPLRGFGVYRISIERRRNAEDPWTSVENEIRFAIWSAPEGSVPPPTPK